jgi:hypothetical protein
MAIRSPPSFSTLITYVPILPDLLTSFASAYKTSPAEAGFIYVIFILSATAAVPCEFAAVSNASSIRENIACGAGESDGKAAC